MIKKYHRQQNYRPKLCPIFVKNLFACLVFMPSSLHVLPSIIRSPMLRSHLELPETSDITSHEAFGLFTPVNFVGIVQNLSFFHKFFDTVPQSTVLSAICNFCLRALSEINSSPAVVFKYFDPMRDRKKCDHSASARSIHRQRRRNSHQIQQPKVGRTVSCSGQCDQLVIVAF